MRRYLLIFMAVLLVAATSEAANIQAPDIIAMPNKNGEVTFNHKKHVAGYGNCKTCHDRKEGKIKGLGKDWAHKVCKGCHEAIMVGPTVCNGCHAKPAK
jgi:predicted CXXCH cytochrome family protein